MTRITRYGRRIKHTLVGAMTAACFACLFAVPFAEKNLLKNEVGYYSVIFNGTEIGSANSREEAEQALAEARLKFSKEYDSIIYMENNIDIVEEARVVSERMSKEELEGAIYSTLFDCVTDRETATAYTVRIDDYTVTLATKDEVVELMEKVAAKYDEDKQFQVQLKAAQDDYSVYAVDIVESGIKDTDIDIVASAMDSTSTGTADDDATGVDGIQTISFAEEVVVNETLAENATILTVDEAYEEITKEKAAKGIYVVVSGDCLSAIARKCEISLDELYSLNPQIPDNDLIIPGDELVVMVPESEISVVVVERKTYEEEYEAEVQYVDDNTAYRGQNTVISEGSAGYHRVTADITYVNGTQTELEYVEETILVESQPKVVAVGTLTPPTYLRPITGGTMTSAFGLRRGKQHTGIDWGIPTGTEVRAAAGGVVTRASWYNGYGYCVDIKHSDGSMTRYAHLSSFLVSVGQTVSQGQPIAKSGNTGNSTGPHLHFEIIIKGTAVNPLNYVNKN